jgi:ligand-binding sensor domain-containing protein/AraC-like DNA-binding protein
MKVNVPFFIFIFLLLSFSVKADVLTGVPGKPLHQYVRVVWRSANGLPHSSVNDIIQDKDGRIWVGTDEGAASFDSSEFKVYDRSIDESFRSNKVTSLLEGDDGTIWMGTEAGLIALRKGKFFLYNEEKGLPSPIVKNLIKGEDGKIWAGTEKGAAFFDTENDMMVSLESPDLKEKSITATVFDKNGNLVFSTEEKGIIEYDGTKTVIPEKINNMIPSVVTALFTSPSGQTFAGTITGEIFNISDITAKPVKVSGGSFGSAVSSIAQDKGGALWVGLSRMGLVRIHGSVVERFDIVDGLPGKGVRKILIDNSNYIWVATDDGIAMFHDGIFSTYTTREGLSSNMAYGILEDSKGGLWVGTRGGGLNWVTPKEVRRFNESNGLPSNLIGGLHEDSMGNIWICTAEGLVKWDGRKMTVYNEKHGLPSKIVGAVYEDSRKTIWAGTMGGQILMLKDGKFSNLFKKTRIAPPNSMIRQIYETRSGILWAATSEGLLKLKKGGYDLYTKKEGLSGDSVLSIYEDNNSNLWITTDDSGINLFDEAKGFIHIRSKDGLPSDTIFSITQDDWNNFWFTSSRGIFHISWKDLMEFVDNPEKKISVRMFGQSDGIRKMENTGGVHPASFRRKNGRLLFPSTGGLIEADPEKLDGTNEPSVIIREILVDGMPYEKEDLLDLPYDTAQIDIRFAPLNFIRNETLAFSYSFGRKDRESEWKDLGTMEMITIRNIPGGASAIKINSYDTKMKNRRKEGVLKEIEVSVKDSPWPERLFFVFIISTSLFAIGYHIVLRSKRKKQLPEKCNADAATTDKTDDNEDVKIDPGIVEEVVKRLKVAMEEKKLFKNPDLSLPMLAKEIKTTTNILSYVINRHLQASFYSFVNGYRIEEAKILLMDKEYDNKNILAVAYDSGFRSKTTFNTMFKKCTGLTPSGYKKSVEKTSL